MEENNSRKILLSVLGVAILVIAVVGVSFAAFSFTGTSDVNVISTNTITMSYSEPTSGIDLENALPVADAVGKAVTGEGNVFKFSVSTTVTGALTIPYEVNITELPSETAGQLLKNQVKIHLTKGESDVEIVAPKLISTLAASTLRAGSLKLYETSDVHAIGGSITNIYTMRIWIDSAVDNAAISDKTYQFRLKVNVDSVVQAVS